MTPAISIAGLTRRYRGQLTLDRVTFDVQDGEVFGFLGPNGAGKPVTELRHSLLARPADCRSPGQRSSSRTRPPSWTYCVRERSATRC
jgi:ABC-type phosphonate transport system ATPase subunit